MRLKKTLPINAAEFSILHELLMEKCFGSRVDEAKNWPDTRLYGHNLGDDTVAIKASIKGIAGISMDTRPLRNAVNQYPSQLEKISKVLLEECLAFLEFDNLEEMVNFYKQSNNLTHYEAPPFLKYAKGDRRTSSTSYKNRIDDKLANLENTQWWSYSHLNSLKEAGKPEMLALPLKINGRLSNGDYEIELIQEDPFTSFKGRIVRNFSGDNVLISELTSLKKVVEKRLYMIIDIDLDASKDLYVGCFLRYTDAGSVYAGTFVMDRIKENLEEEALKPRRVSLETASNGTKEVIRKYLYDKKLNVLKIPRNIFSQGDFENWMQRKEQTREVKAPEFDLFIAAPIKGFSQQEKSFKDLKDCLLSELSNDLLPDLKISLESKVDAAFAKYHKKNNLFYGEKTNFEFIRKEIISMVNDLKSRDIGFDRVWYAPESEHFSVNNKMDAGIQLLTEIDNFNLSRSFMLILPGPMISSAIFEAGWAAIVERNINVYLFYNKLEDLPYMLRKASALKNRKILMASFEETGGIAGIPDYLVDSKIKL